MAGAGFDEALLAQAFAVQGGTAVFLPDATLWHLDEKTLTQACDELRRRGEATVRVLTERRLARAAEQTADSILGSSRSARLRRLAMRCFWGTPGPFLFAARLLRLIAEHGPSRLVPRSFCHAPLRLAGWEGMYSVVPAFDDLLRPLRQARAGDNPTVVTLQLPKGGATDILESLVTDLRDEFVSNTQYGLDGCLSQRIRHGTPGAPQSIAH